MSDHGHAAGSCPWLDLMGRGTEVRKGPDLSGGNLREMEDVDRCLRDSFVAALSTTAR